MPKLSSAEGSMIFQIFLRAIDDVLSEQIGKTCHVYVEDVIIFFKNETDHVEHLDWILKVKVFKTSVGFLGIVMTDEGTRADGEKVKAIKEHVEPKSLFELRSFLGLASYHRSFVRDFVILKGDIGSVNTDLRKCS